jgi:hypothetical protein
MAVRAGLIVGGESNSIPNGFQGFIGGGLGNMLSSSYATIAGGQDNINDSQGGAIGGGQNNYIITGYQGFIGGGYGNTVNNDYAAIGGGGINTADGSHSAIAGGQGNLASGDYTAVAGGFNNTAAGLGSFVGGGGIDAGGNEANEAYAPASTIAGGNGNIITVNGTHSFIGGGFENGIDSTNCVIAGGAGNAANGATYGYSTVGGGAFNNAGSYATVAGGIENSAGGFGSFVGGGGFDTEGLAGNSAEAVDSAIGGGLGNTAGGAYSFIGAGWGNTANGNYAVAAGGFENETSAYYATIGGGQNNTNGGQGGTIAGGQNNNITTGFQGFIGGGYGNTVSGNYAVVPGGGLNTASGSHSLACGQNATASGNNAFVWSDGSAATSSGVNNSVTFRGSGGYFFFTSSEGIGAQLEAGTTSWTSLSDRNAKKNFKPVDTVAVLDRLASVPIQQWNYKWEADESVPNIGPMAQDFKGAFYPGRDDKHISTLEFDGIELAAIQGLNKKMDEHTQSLENELKQKDAEIATLRTKTTETEKRLEELEAIVQSLAAKK